ncbi:asparagine synthetase B family protein [Devosia sp. Naph2]|uniref:asparagine synthetase B family protein n=1 Tax=Devosia polycyclovorans TaxID=3345148 RepID=UPI0035D031D9
MSGFAGLFTFNAEGSDTTVLQKLHHAIASGSLKIVADHAPILFAASDGRRNSLQFVALDIVGEARLDNRDDLKTALGAPHALDDLGLVAMAVLRWGQRAATLLNGEFAIAIFDRREKKLLLLRDLFGVKPLYYRQQDNCLAFSSMQSDLVHEGDEPDPNAMARFILGVDDDANATMFDTVKRLPPGHLLAMEMNGDWRLIQHRVPKPARFTGDWTAYQLRNRLDGAVRRRAAAANKVGALLSGGLDSSAICGLAARASPGAILPVYSFHYPPGSPHDEGRHIEAMQGAHRLSVSRLSMHDFDPLLEVEPLIDPCADPVFAPGLGKLLRLYRQARSDGVTVLLDGHGGDEVISHGTGLAVEFVRARRWIALWNLLGALQNLYGQSRVALYWDVLTAHTGLRRFRSRRDQRHGGGVAPLAFLDAAHRAEAARRAKAWADKYAGAQQSEAALHLWNISNPAVARGFETLSRAATSQSVELSFPFFDHALVEAALAVPGHEKVRHGLTRHALRLALAGILPDSVRWRRDKVDFSAELRQSLVHHAGALRNAADLDGPLSGIVDKDALVSQVNRLLDAPDQFDSTTSFILFRCAVLARWLERRQTGRGAQLGAAE